MGIVNVTPDSFSDGGIYLDAAAAIEHGFQLARDGAAVLDVGGESTRPGAEAVAADEELRRVLPVVHELAANAGVPVSIDTTKARVARAALEAGASIVNDVSGGTADPEMLGAVATSGAMYVAMHMRGTPRTMRDEAHYNSVVDDVATELRARVERGLAAGIPPEALLADPGIGFAKTAAHSLALLHALPEIGARVGAPLLVGTSRKSFLSGVVADGAATDRDAATLATTVWCFERGVAMVRVHDVRSSRRAALLLDALEEAAA
jgi:dihydropteroate synthase